MARKEARIFTSVWSDEAQSDFRSLTVGAQWLYWALASQPELSMCGVLTEAVERWSHLAGDAKPRAIRSHLAELHAGRFVVHDQTTSEVWIRSLIRRDGVLSSPNLVVAMARAYEEVHSADIRAGIAEEVRREFPGGFWQGITERFPKRFPYPFREGFRQPFPEGFLKGLGEGMRDAVHGPCTHAHARHPITPSPLSPLSSLLPPPSSSESDLHAADPTPDDDAEASGRDQDLTDDTLAEACKILAERHLARRIIEKGPVADEHAWLVAARRRLAAQHADIVRDRAPSGVTPDQLADMLEPPTGNHAPDRPGPALPAPYQPDPTPQTEPDVAKAGVDEARAALASTRRTA